MNPGISSIVLDDLKYLAKGPTTLKPEDIMHLILMDSNFEQCHESMDLKPKIVVFIQHLVLLVMSMETLEK